MITPRSTRLVRVPDLNALRAAIAQRVPADVLEARRTAVIVPTRGAAEELRRTLENAAGGSRALVLPDLVTRAGLYQGLHAGLRGAPRLLDAAEREVLLRRAAREASAEGAAPPFRLRAGLIVQMLDFYDELHRREQSLDDFARLASAPLAASAGIDRGAERLLRQTEFLCAAYARFERLCAGSDGTDEHGLRAILAGGAPQHTWTRIIVTHGDQAVDPRGLHSSDFSMLSRTNGLSRLEVVATESLLASGFHQRLHDLLPGIEEERSGVEGAAPVLVAPESADGHRWFTCRDREEELVELVRWLAQRAGSSHEPVRPPALDRFGVVFQRPLPYLYLARQVFADGHLPHEALDALPLAGEPFAATVDVILSFISSEASRPTSLELLRSPHLVFSEALSPREIAALDATLRDLDYTGGWDALPTLQSRSAAAAPALARLQEAAAVLRTVGTLPHASRQLDALAGFIRTFERHPAATDAWRERHLRARAAILSALESLRSAHERHDDEALEVDELAGTLRRWIDSHTFAPRTGAGGVRLLDAASAPYADLDELRLVGLIERDWPEPAPRSIFYPSSILSALGWPPEAPRMAAARARFQDLLRSARHRVSASAFTLEDDAIVTGSPFLEEIESAALAVERWPRVPAARLFTHEFVEAGIAAGGTAANDWLQLRRARTSPADSRFRGSTGPRDARTYAVSYLERYLECPFKYLASQVLKLPEEREEEPGLSPIERGHLIHAVFEAFFAAWQAAGGGTITIANVADALELFESVAARHLETIPEADRALERTHLLGSAAASGLAERAFAFEIEQGGHVVERLLEHELEGEYTFAGAAGERRVRIKSKADRIDLMADGSMRIIDYKLGRAPKMSRALQLPIYSVIATQELEGHRGRSWTVANAGYVAFREKEAFVPLGGRTSALGDALKDGQQRMLDAIDRIERGEFPVQPDEPFRCQWCGYAGVCRKDYVGDE